MTVRELLNSMRDVKEISFIHDNCQIETIDATAAGSFRAVKAHFDENVFRFFAIGDGKIRIDSK